MNRNSIIKRFSLLSHPVIENVEFFDDGCEFSIFTSQAGVRCLVGGGSQLYAVISLATILIVTMLPHGVQ